MEKTITDILIKNSTIVFKWNSISPIWCWQIIKWRTNKTNNKQRALENLFKCRRHLNDCVYADEGARVSISVRCSLSAHRRVKVYYTQGSSSSIHTVHVWFLYSAAIIYMRMRFCISQSDCLGGPQKKATCILLYYKHFPVCCNSYYIYYLNICTLIGPLFLCV
jgi:hypothetical protein